MAHGTWRANSKHEATTRCVYAMADYLHGLLHIDPKQIGFRREAPAKGRATEVTATEGLQTIYFLFIFFMV